ncbi:MAG: hypothetical protein C0631_10600 [Sedimenticola sp.]|nr:MAG: hypothetical protein C0631_10600 [Sedimenticola sp.]
MENTMFRKSFEKTGFHLTLQLQCRLQILVLERTGTGYGCNAASISATLQFYTHAAQACGLPVLSLGRTRPRSGQRRARPSRLRKS